MVKSVGKCGIIGQELERVFCAQEEDLHTVHLREVLKLVLEEQVAAGYRYFLSGMSRGYGVLCAEIVMKLKQKEPDVSLECDFPYEEQAARWTEPERNRYFSIAEQCDKIVLLQTRYSSACVAQANRYMIDHSQMLLAVFDGLLGETMRDITYARRQGKPVLCVHPGTFEVTRMDTAAVGQRGKGSLPR